jgi:hypothetical protein
MLQHRNYEYQIIKQRRSFHVIRLYSLTLTMSGPDRLKAELKRDPDYLRAFRDNCEEDLELELEKLGIARVRSSCIV